MTSDDTVALPSRSGAAGGTDPHPVTVEALIGRIDTQLDTVWTASERRGLLAGATEFAAAVHELVLLAQSLEGLAAERAEMLRSTAAALTGKGAGGYEDVMALLDEDGVS